MYKKIILLLSVVLIGAEPVISQHAEHFQVLLFTKSISYPSRHNSISDGAQMFKELSKKHRFGLTWTADAAIFDDTERLNRMDVIVFFNTSGDVLNESQKQSFQDYIQDGGNFVGIHGASYTMMDWPWYIKLLGGVWNDHPGRHTAAVHVQDSNHPAAAHLPSTWLVTDEWYDFKKLSANINVILTVDESTYPGGKMPDFHPISWYQDDFEGGRSFYTLFRYRIRNKQRECPLASVKKIAVCCMAFT